MDPGLKFSFQRVSTVSQLYSRTVQRVMSAIRVRDDGLQSRILVHCLTVKQTEELETELHAAGCTSVCRAASGLLPPNSFMDTLPGPVQTRVCVATSVMLAGVSTIGIDCVVFCGGVRSMNGCIQVLSVFCFSCFVLVDVMYLE